RFERPGDRTRIVLQTPAFHGICPRSWSRRTRIVRFGCKTQPHLQYTHSVANRNHEDREMTPFTQALAADPTPSPSRQAPYECRKAGADKVVAEITAKGGKAVAVKGDVSKAAEAQGIIDAAVKNYGRLDILVNNSGVYEFAPIEAVTEDSFHRQFDINVLGL